jgi:hypothetical protein
MSKLGFIARIWYYFRLGYGTYLTFFLGYASTLVTVYYLAIKNMPPLLDVFPNFKLFAILATAVGGPLAAAIGWMHMKRSPAFSSEMDVTYESNPYLFKLPSGYTKDVMFPFYIELLVQLRRILESQNLLTDEDSKRITALEEKLHTLVDGGFVGTPRTRR